MKNILITGATGNIGFEVIRFLYSGNTTNKIFAGVRNIEKAKSVFNEFPELGYVYFDFDDFESFNTSLEGIDTVFLLRPPHVSDVDKYFRPLISCIRERQIKEVMFLSVQGAERSRVIPHHKIEHLIRDYDVDHIFLRPAYFMQNLTTTLMDGIKNKREIILPAGKAKFNWVDIENIGEVAAILLDDFENYKNQAFEITGYENESFEKVADLINQVVQTPVKYRSVNPFRFYGIKRREGMKKGMILVMVMLHFLPRFQKPSRFSGFYEELTGKKPTSLKSFITREQVKFEKEDKTGGALS